MSIVTRFNTSANAARICQWTLWSFCSYQEEKEELQHDRSNAIDKIEAWKAHILRAVHQDVAKEDILNSMTPQQVLIIMDWAMKFLPLKFRETQGEWFGKKGRSCHVTAVISKPNQDFEVDTT